MRFLMNSKIIDKLKTMITNLLDSSYMTYQNNADRKIKPFLVSVLKSQAPHPKLLLEVVLFKINKVKYILNKRDLFNSLVALEESNNTAFLNGSVNALAELFKSNHFNYPLGGLIDSNLLKNLKTGAYINPFTEQPILLSVVSDDSNKCIRFSTKYLFSGGDETSTVVINDNDTREIAVSMRLSESLVNREDIAREYIIYHELSHDSHFQNYRIYKDAVKMASDIPKKTKRLQEIEADISSILYIIKNRKLNDVDAFDLINGVMNFRCSISAKTALDVAIKCPTEDSVHYHITQPSLLILSRMINDEGIGFIHQMKNLEIANIAYHIANIVSDDYYFYNYISLLPTDSDEFKTYLLDTANEKLTCFYLLSYYGEEITTFSDAPIDIRKEKFSVMADELVKKLYSKDELISKHSLFFRTLVAYQYAININPEKIQNVYLSRITGVFANIVYENFLERLAIDKPIEIEHKRNLVTVKIK